MRVVFDHRAPGTAEQEWVSARPWADAPRLDAAVERLVILSAHPDDETLGSGGLIATAAASGIDVSVIVATDGESSHPDSAGAAGLGARRRLEVVSALRELAPGARMRFLGLPDGGLREHAAALRQAVQDELGPLPHGVLLAAPWWGDGHRDHRVAGEVALSVHGPGVRVVGYPIWLWHWANPAEIDVVVDPASWRILPLTPRVGAAKASAIGQHASQVHPLSDRAGEEAIVHEGMAAHFSRPFEMFIDADPPRAALSADRSMFEDFFRSRNDPWGFETSWYEERKRAVLLAALPRRRFTRALELGCATGVLTTQLAARADAVLAVDLSTTALQKAQDRLRGADTVRFVQGTLPHDWPPGRFDLVVLSEIGYYWSRADLDTARRRIGSALAEDGILVACHWRHASPDAPLTGDEVHAALGADTAWTSILHHLEEDFVLDVYRRRPTPAAAQGSPA
ncbi:bifunctional PIG-L family deacetylase/class I SAM-dependent methyltransferase [Microbacterium sp. SS28]|uniref:bifunctional PIG-L family deacetylase/class I SAM-dependent methyltransferase n=1 Tax=Microbacterium sp. SS28 TaxID=2919948 RepID=UPI001FAA1330|nr:bifunctional PIG-L family deacetylase/class I SAM-dependent methyltransferase [Microbacterium sp. SS28]